MEMKEIWMPINGLKNLYKISSFGRIFRYERVIENGNFLKKMPSEIIDLNDEIGEHFVYLLDENGVYNLRSIPELVAEHFMDGYELGMEIEHIDGTEDFIWNLRIKKLEYHPVTNEKVQMTIVTNSSQTEEQRKKREKMKEIRKRYYQKNRERLIEMAKDAYYRKKNG